MAEVQAGYVHAGGDEFPDLLRRGGPGTQRTNDFGSPH